MQTTKVHSGARQGRRVVEGKVGGQAAVPNPRTDAARQSAAHAGATAGTATGDFVVPSTQRHTDETRRWRRSSRKS